MKTDNTTAEGLANDTVKQKRSKAIDMRFYWIRDRVKQGQYHVYWRKAEFNRADYFTKHHAPKHHLNMRHAYLHQSNHAHNRNYYEALQCNDCDTEHEDSNLDVHFAPLMHSQSFDPTDCPSDTRTSCEGVLIPIVLGNPDPQSRDTGDVITEPAGMQSDRLCEPQCPNGIQPHNITA